MGREHQIGRQDAQAKHHDRQGTGPNLLAGDAGPVEAHAIDGEILKEAADVVDGLARTAAWGRTAFHHDRAEQVEAGDHRGTGGGLDADELREGDGLAGGVFGVKPAQLLRGGAEGLIRLHKHPPHPAPLEGVVHIKGADVEAEGLHGALEIHPQSGHAIPIHQDLQLGRFRGKLGEHPIKEAAGVGVADQLLGAGKELGIGKGAATAVEHLEFEAAAGAVAGNGRRLDHEDARLLDRGELAVEPRHDGAHRLVGAGPLVPLPGAEEKQPAVGRVAGKAGATEHRGALDVLLLPQNRGHPLVDLARVLQGAAIRRLQDADGIALVFHRHEATGDGVESHRGEGDAGHQGAHDQGAVGEHPGQALLVTPLDAAIAPVEPAKQLRSEPAKECAAQGEGEHGGGVRHTPEHQPSHPAGQGKGQPQGQAGEQLQHKPHQQPGGNSAHGGQGSPSPGGKQAIEKPHRPSCDGVGATARWRAFPAQQEGREHRGEGEGVEGGDGDGKEDRGGELPVDGAGGAGEEEHRNKYREQHQGGGQHRAKEVVHGGLGRRQSPQAGGFLGGGGFDDRDRVIHHQPGG